MFEIHFEESPRFQKIDFEYFEPQKTQILRHLNSRVFLPMPYRFAESGSGQKRNFYY